MAAYAFANIAKLLEDEHRFSIIEEFAVLSPERKLMLCERLFTRGGEVFERSVKLLWPRAARRDMQKLERFLILLKNTAH